MSEQNRTILKSYFETNAIPTSVQFANFIDSVINKREDEITVSSGNIGFGNQNPLTNVSVQSKTFQLSGIVSAAKNSNSFTGTNTVFSGQLAVNDTIQISGTSYTVASVVSNINFTTHQNTSAAVTNATVQKTADIFSVLDKNGNAIIYITKDGKVGFSKNNPSELVDIAGNLKAERLIGNGAGLTNIPANQLKGIIPEVNLPEMKVSSVEGLLTITETYDKQLTGNVNGTTATKTINGTGTKFQTELVANQKIMIGTEVFEVETITSETVLTLKNALTNTITNETAFAKGDFLKLVAVDGNTVASIDGKGTVSATSFKGNATDLTNIPANQLKGIIPEVNLPEMKVSSVEGLLTITETFDQKITGTLSGTIETTTLNGTGTKFQTELVVNQKIMIGTEFFEVETITSDTVLTLKNTLANTITNETAFAKGDFLKLVTVDGTTIASIDGKGIVSATSFIGNAAGLTNIPANQLKGIIPEVNLPEMKVSSVEGLLTITETYDKQLTGTLSGTIETTTLNGTGTKFQTELVVNQKIMIGTEVFEVEIITSETVLTLKNTLANTITNENAFAKGDFLKLVTVDGTTVASIDGKGIVSATSFKGNATDLTNIPANQLKGIIPEVNLPEMKVSSVEGLLTITETYDKQLTGNVNGTTATKTINGTGTKFQTELVANQKIMIGTEVFEVETITSETVLTLKNTLANTITNETAFAKGDFLKLVTVDGNTVASIDGKGTVSATSFIGNATDLTNIPANQLKGIIPEVNLPEMKVSSVEGLLTITETFDQKITGTLSGTIETTTLNGTGTKFQTELVANQKIQIGTTIFEVETITSETVLTLKNALANTITNETAFAKGDFLKLVTVDGTTVASIDGKGTVSATSFIGNAAGLTNIPADQLKGIIPEVNLPEMKVSSVEGLLTITETFDQKITGTLSGTIETTTLNGTGTKFQTELVANQKIQIGTTIFEVETITSETVLTLKNTLANTITNETAFAKGDFLKLVAVDGNTVASIDGKGTVSATSFKGNATDLTNIPANQLKGIIPEVNLPEMKVSSVEGLLTITETFDQKITGTVNGTIETTTLNGTGTKFQTELVANQKIMIGTEVFEVETITSETVLTLKNTLANTITNKTAFAKGDFLKLVAIDGTTVASIDGKGIVSATSFIGDAAGLTNIPANQLKGIIPEVNLPEMKVSSVEGLLTITETFDQKITGTVNGTTATKTINGTGTKFQTELVANQKIMIGTEFFEVETITSDTVLTLKNKLANTITNEIAFAKGDFLKLVAIDGTTVASIDGKGIVSATSFIGNAAGLTNIPADKITGNLNLAGEITATSFTGDATGLTNIPADKITGNLNLEGEITATNFTGDATGLTNIPADKITGNLNLSGEITATSFTGNGSKLTTLNAAQITGLVPEISIPQIAATKITGTLPVTSIPDVPSTKISGKLASNQIPTLAPSKVQKYISVFADETILLNEATLSLSWKTNSVSNLTVQFLHYGAIVNLSTSDAKIALTESNYLIKQLYQNTVFTFISTDANGAVIDQEQLYITVIPTANQYTQQLKWEGFGIAYVIQQVASRFTLSELTTASLTTLGTAIFNAGYSATDAFRYIPQYYRNQGETWDLAIDGGILTKIFSGGKPPQAIINQYAQYLVDSGDSPKMVISYVVEKFGLKTSSNENITALGTAIKLAGISAGDAFRYVASFYRSTNQPWSPGVQGTALTKVYTS